MSNNKIIILIAFISVALITSLFVFRLSHKVSSTTISADTGLFFPTPRELQPFELTDNFNQPFTQKKLLQHWTLLFFGFTHCTSICPQTLALLNRVYAPLHAQNKIIQVVFISLDPERDNKETLAKYVHTFNPDFISVSGNLKALRQLQSQFGIFSARDPAAPSKENYQIQHTPSIILINPEGKWAGLFKADIKPQQLTEAMRMSMK